MELPPASWLSGGVSIGVGGRPLWPCDEGGGDPSDEGSGDPEDEGGGTGGGD